MVHAIPLVERPRQTRPAGGGGRPVRLPRSASVWDLFTTTQDCGHNLLSEMSRAVRCFQRRAPLPADACRLDSRGWHTPKPEASGTPRRIGLGAEGVVAEHRVHALGLVHD